MGGHLRTTNLFALLTVALSASTFALSWDTVAVSVNANGIFGDQDSGMPAVSGNGRFVVFESNAANLTAADDDSWNDIYVRDLHGWGITCVSTPLDGFVKDGGSYNPAISADGRFIVFSSYSTGLVVGDGNQASDIFLYDWQSGSTELVSVSTSGSAANHDSTNPSISADGRFVVFDSHASNLVGSDTNGCADIFIRDRLLGITSRVNVSASGQQANSTSYDPWIAGNGLVVAYESYASNLGPGGGGSKRDIFVHDLQTGDTSLASLSTNNQVANSGSYDPCLSYDGRVVAFESRASNLVSGDTNTAPDVFVRDRTAKTTRRASVTTAGVQGNDHSRYACVSGDGRLVAFTSHSTNLISGDTNDAPDIFVRNLVDQTTERWSLTSENGQIDDGSYFPASSSDGGVTAFVSQGRNITENPKIGDTLDVYVRTSRRLPRHIGP
ncbi:MAG: hypothetical protein HONBIEJF_01105 [Fimbriimonadaceae bacterium]|nr:hypothetical protein [Fimbriimonadaceae bacterium]